MTLSQQPRRIAASGLLAACALAAWAIVAGGTMDTPDTPAAEQPLAAYAPTLDQSAFFSYLQFRLSHPPLPAALDITPDLGWGESARLATEAMNRASQEFETATTIAIPDKGALLREYRDALAAYLIGTRDAMEGYWRDKGLPSLANHCDCNTESMWEARTRTLRGAPLSGQVAFVRPRYLGGQLVECAFTLPVTSIADRPGRYPRVENPARERLSVFELIVAVEAVDAQGAPFLGYLGLWMTYDHQASPGRWVVSKVSIYNRPDFVGVVPPNI